VFDIAADIWVAGLGRRNRSYDADLLIVATAIEQAATLVTGNVNHFSWMPGVLIEDWRRSP
jgi:predicted nucleic acid-binding protein